MRKRSVRSWIFTMWISGVARTPCCLWYWGFHPGATDAKYEAIWPGTVWPAGTAVVQVTPRKSILFRMHTDGRSQRWRWVPGWRRSMRWRRDPWMRGRKLRCSSRSLTPSRDQWLSCCRTVRGRGKLLWGMEGKGGTGGGGGGGGGGGMLSVRRREGDNEGDGGKTEAGNQGNGEGRGRNPRGRGGRAGRGMCIGIGKGSAGPVLVPGGGTGGGLDVPVPLLAGAWEGGGEGEGSADRLLLQAASCHLPKDKGEEGNGWLGVKFLTQWMTTQNVSWAWLFKIGLGPDMDCVMEDRFL